MAPYVTYPCLISGLKTEKNKLQEQTMSTNPNNSNNNKSSYLSIHEPTTELRDGVEWVSFVYSHHRTLRKYCIRTDLDKVDIGTLDEKFKKENCVKTILVVLYGILIII